MDIDDSIPIYADYFHAISLANTDKDIFADNAGSADIVPASNFASFDLIDIIINPLKAKGVLKHDGTRLLVPLHGSLYVPAGDTTDKFPLVIIGHGNFDGYFEFKRIEPASGTPGTFKYTILPAEYPSFKGYENLQQYLVNKGVASYSINLNIVNSLENGEVSGFNKLVLDTNQRILLFFLHLKLLKIIAGESITEPTVNASPIKFFDGTNLISLNDAIANPAWAKLIAIAAFGVPDAFPLVFSTAVAGRKTILLTQVQNVLAAVGSMTSTVDQMLMQAGSAASIDQKINLLVQAGKTLFGNEFTIIPLFSYNNAADVGLSFGDKDLLTAYAKTQTGSDYSTEEWMQSTSCVRPKLANWDYIRTMFEMLNNNSLDLTAVQLPYRAQDSWLAVEFPDTNSDGSPFTITNDTLSIVVHGDSGCFGSGFQAGMLVDDWTELIPSSKETTGISFNYNQPNAMAPQALLLAVTPVETGSWNWDELMGILNDTLLRAKLRAVEPDLLDKAGKPELSVLFPALISTFSQNDLDISLDFRTNVPFYATTIPITSLAVSV